MLRLAAGFVILTWPAWAVALTFVGVPFIGGAVGVILPIALFSFHPDWS